ncbi:MAG: aspartyl protease [Gomphosphaeria aponina SAG 52.96 = DSM 107014]|uniref:Aspartyl protease n=1 Tax=Gomphosphaeria aponina SAG 52.96 = DSM 107014 TaxID=1521640 RepID=A0A941JTB2_9CHRO|nr:aspartyl protease [Gomphosphaeria aponina SAG 52.96 = DSM 107014]
MIQGYFGENGELFFELDLVTVDGEILSVNGLLDTGFTDWLAMNIQDIESLDWQYIKKRQMKTARGESRFNLYQGTVIFDGQELTIPVLGGEEITEVLLGLAWLENRRLLADKKAGLLTLEEV